MKQHASPRTLLLGALALVAGTIAGCTQTVNTRGQVILPSRLAQIQPGVTTRQDVLQLLGSPSTAGTLNDNRWYYVTASVASSSLNPYELKSRQVVIIDFDPGKDIVASISQKTKEDGKEVDPDADLTETHGQSLGVVEQMLDSLGGVMNK